jgi:hypothetical protein
MARPQCDTPPCFTYVWNDSNEIQELKLANQVRGDLGIFVFKFNSIQPI